MPEKRRFSAALARCGGVATAPPHALPEATAPLHPAGMPLGTSKKRDVRDNAGRCYGSYRGFVADDSRALCIIIALPSVSWTSHAVEPIRMLFTIPEDSNPRRLDSSSRYAPGLRRYSLTTWLLLSSTALTATGMLAPALAQQSWTGSLGSNWFAPGNWTSAVPTTADAVTIAGTPPADPVIIGGSASASTVTVTGGRTLGVSGGGGLSQASAQQPGAG